ncbi:Ctdspl2 [Symbiodinium pilosum]|uniref:Ctdspl2 protein n=1 Tax=Symbiodinium pilosum TaxID=2952 RepID=A0A812SGK4_SYMPI|nr:Ctdspl2 [Symbiodinium pilosum]
MAAVVHPGAFTERELERRPIMGVTMPNPEEEPPAWSELDESLRAALRFLAYECVDPGPVPEGPALLPRQECAGESVQRMTVVLDLDETLSHCRLEPLEKFKPDFCVQFEESKATGYVYVRPHARLFLEVAARLFEVVVFTASSKGYADQVLDQLDPERKRISTRLYRQHCVERSGAFLKDLRRMGRQMDRCLLVDNSPVSLALCPDNGVVVSSWTAEDPEDNELMELLLMLQQCEEEVSVPKFLGQRYGLRAMVDLLRRRPELLED